MKRNYSIDIIKFYFAIAIALSHYSKLQYGRIVPILHGGFIVPLFFVMSGFFLVSSFDSGKYDSAGSYTLKRIAKIYPYYIAAFIALFSFHVYIGRLGIEDVFIKFSSSLPEIFMLQNSGVFKGSINYPLWQISCLIIASHFLFSLLVWNRQLSLNLICPILALLVVTYYANVHSNREITSWGVESAVFYMPLVKAAGYISLGMSLHGPIYRAVNYLESCNKKFTPTVVSLASILFFVLLWHNRTSNAIVIPFTLILICFLYSQSFYAKHLRFPLLSKLEKLSLGYYFNHALIIEIMPKIENIFTGLSQRMYDLIFIIILTVYSIVMFYTIDKVTAVIKKVRIK